MGAWGAGNTAAKGTLSNVLCEDRVPELCKLSQSPAASSKESAKGADWRSARVTFVAGVVQFRATLVIRNIRRNPCVTDTAATGFAKRTLLAWHVLAASPESE